MKFKGLLGAMFLAIVMMLSVSALKAQKPPEVRYDTSKVPVLILYVVDSVSGKSETGFVTRVTKFEKKLVRPASSNLEKDDSVVFKRVEQPVDYKHYQIRSGKWHEVRSLIDFDINPFINLSDTSSTKPITPRRKK